MVKETKFYFFINIYNFIFLVLYFFFFDLEKEVILYKILIVLLFISILVFVSLSFKSKFLIIFKNLQIPIFFFITLILFLEITSIFRINILPKEIVYYLNNSEKNNFLFTSKVEQLHDSPFIKFKKNTEITSQGKWRGADKIQFVYSWLSDKNGFKNLKKYEDIEKSTTIALGDSMTEGMGVDTKDTWSTLLSEKGLKTYNLGVQGYSPSQIISVFKMYKQLVTNQQIIFAYTLGTYKREKVLIDNPEVFKKQGTGGIQQIIINEKLQNKARFIISAFWLSISDFRIIIKQNFKKFKNYNYNNLDKNLNKYEAAIFALENERIEKNFTQSQEWSATINAIKELKKLANKNLIIIIIPTRELVYYERITGRKLPSNLNKLSEIKELENFSKNNNISFINPLNELISYTNNLPMNYNIQDLPYLEIDGHFSKIGHKLISENIFLSIN